MSRTTHDKPVKILHSGHVIQLRNEQDLFALQKNGNIHRIASYTSNHFTRTALQASKRAEIHTGRQADKEAGRYAGMQSYMQAVKQTNMQADRQSYIHTGKHTCSFTSSHSGKHAGRKTDRETSQETFIQADKKACMQADS